MAKDKTKPNWKNVRVTLGKLQPWIHNPRTIDKKDAERLDQSLDEFGQVDVFAIGPNFEVYNGHQRLGRMLIKYGPKHVVDARQSDRPLNETERRKLTALLHAGATGRWDWEGLAGWDKSELEDWFGKDNVKRYRHDANKLEMLLLGEAPADADIPEADLDKAEELLKKWKVNTGDIWQLGNHRVICGDSTSFDVMAQLLGAKVESKEMKFKVVGGTETKTVTTLVGGEKIMMVWTDPPWNVAYGGNIDAKNNMGYKKREIANDNLGDKFPAFCDAFMTPMAAACRPGATIYLKMSAQEWAAIHSSIVKAGFHWSSTIIWNKDRPVLSRKDYHTKYEPLWYGWLTGAPRLVGVHDRKQSDVWDIARPGRSEEHPTMTPPELIIRSIQNSSRPGAIVLDSFLGSGSTLVSCEATGRSCRGLELMPKYVAVTLERWAVMTGKTPVLISSNTAVKQRKRKNG